MTRFASPAGHGRSSPPFRRGAAKARRGIPDESATESSLRDLLHSKHFGDGGSEAGDVAPVADRTATSAPEESGGEAQPKTQMQMDIEREHFVKEVCCETTRKDVKAWVSKIYDMERLAAAKPLPQPTGQLTLSTLPKRRTRARSTGSLSETGSQQGSLAAAGGASIATGSRRADGATGSRAYDSDAESMVVHHSRGDEPMSQNERLRAYLAGTIPELTEHVNAHVGNRTELLRMDVDEDLRDNHMRTTKEKKVFDNRANSLRWQNTRRMALQQRLEDQTGMKTWIVDAISTWDQKKALQSKEQEISETDLIYDYLTKRAAHIDPNKLPAAIPIFKTLHASYSLPRMWKDKYLK